jgi:regulator of RNase E activity RraA
VTVLPGDVLLSDPEGLTFIPAHLAEPVADHSENIRLRDEWGHMMLREGRYTPGQVDTRWTEAMEAEFAKWKETRKAQH